MTSSTKISHTFIQTEIYFFAQLICTLNYVYSLTQRAGLFFHSNFYRPCIFMTGEMVPIEDSKLVVETWYCCHRHYSYVCILKSCRGYWPTVTKAICTYNHTATYRLHNHSKLNHLYCFTLFFQFATTHFILALPNHPPYECCPKIDAFLKKSSKPSKISCHLVCQVSCVKAKG